MLTFVCFKWKRGGGHQLPSVCEYTARHVNILRSMLNRHVHIPHRLVCVTDCAEGINKNVDVVPLWDKCLELGGCYNRLWVFSREAEEVFGSRFVCIDLDVVLLNDCTPLFDREDEFIINTYRPGPPRHIDQHYNAGLFMMTAGARSSVWDSFDPETTPMTVQQDPDCIGTDQAWIRQHLGKGESRWGEEDGVFEAPRMRDVRLQHRARLVLFAGRRDPSMSNAPWVRSHWK